MHPSDPWGLQGISVLGGDQDVTGQAPEQLHHLRLFWAGCCT